MTDTQDNSLRMPKVGEILYPCFDGYWRHNGGGWTAINIERSGKIKGYDWVARVAPQPTDCASFLDWDDRMAGKWMTTQSPRIGLVVLIEGEVPVATIRRGEGTLRGPWDQNVLPLDPPGEVCALEVTHVGLKSVRAKVIKLASLPEGK